MVLRLRQQSLDSLAEATPRGRGDVLKRVEQGLQRQRPEQQCVSPRHTIHRSLDVVDVADNKSVGRPPVAAAGSGSRSAMPVMSGKTMSATTTLNIIWWMRAAASAPLAQ